MLFIKKIHISSQKHKNIQNVNKQSGSISWKKDNFHHCTLLFGHMKLFCFYFKIAGQSGMGLEKVAGPMHFQPAIGRRAWTNFHPWTVCKVPAGGQDWKFDNTVEYRRIVARLVRNNPW